MIGLDGDNCVNKQSLTLLCNGLCCVALPSFALLYMYLTLCVCYVSHGVHYCHSNILYFDH